MYNLHELALSRESAVNRAGFAANKLGSNQLIISAAGAFHG
jgi:hypothetical protein